MINLTKRLLLGFVLGNSILGLFIAVWNHFDKDYYLFLIYGFIFSGSLIYSIAMERKL